MHTWVEISKSALIHNAQQCRLLCASAKMIAVVKANAYGHGLKETGLIIQDAVEYLAVINMEEARVLRASGVHTPIIILGYTDESAEELVWAASERVEVVINSLSHAQRISQLLSESGGSGAILAVHAKVDTGLGRMGILPENAVSYIKQVTELPHVYLKGVESHFADVADHREYAKEQLKTFENIKYQLFREKVEPLLWHIAKTEAILDFPESHMDAVRLGIGLYGLWPGEKPPARLLASHPKFSLKPSLTWKARILQVKEYSEGAYIGYGCTHQCSRKTKIAVIPAGYYEGYPRVLSNKGSMLIRGTRCPVLGRVCMNMTMVDVTRARGVCRGDEAVLIGAQRDSEITAAEVAHLAGTVHYEIVCNINPLIKRIVVA